nr:PREDICTED: cytosolic phospholipase A2 epsilon [Anolis carolinensis]|eukprot:XP_016847703.1 PREDICTED: cytosolic phospholipase A2 epsilon [Anolis carolinensis]
MNFGQFAAIFLEALLSNTDMEVPQYLSQTCNIETIMAPSGSAKEMDDSPCYLLTVRIIQIKNLRKADLFSQSDCYVSLFLPTASFERVQTKSIKDCKNPVWNETFSFRIQSQVKNVLELMVHDEDNCIADEHLLTVLFDIYKIHLGETVCLVFPLDPKVQEQLEVEFSLESIPVRKEHIVTNDVLVSREISCLEVQVNEGKTKKKTRETNLKFTVQGSYEETQEFLLGSELHPVDPLVFHYIKYKESALELEVPKKSRGKGLSSSGNADEKASFILPLDLQETEKKLIIGKDNMIDLNLKIKDWWGHPSVASQLIGEQTPIDHADCWLAKNLDVRLGYDLCVDEDIVIQKRKKLAAITLQKVLHLQRDLQEHEVPVVAVMTTGGSARAFTALHGNLYGLQKLDLLDCISYITGSSGSTWTLSNLYQHANWSQQDLSDYNPVIVIKWCWLIHFLKQKRSTLSEQKCALSHGQNPLPIYMVLNTRDKYSLPEFKEWMEFTPFEVGLLKYGAYIRSENFGSKFFMGRMMKKVPESQICFMEGVWSNVFSYNLLDSWRALDTSEESFWHKYTRDRVKDIEEWPSQPSRPQELHTQLVIPAPKFPTILREIITKRITTSEVYNFLMGFQLSNEYLDNENFYIWKDTVLDTFPNQLTATSEYLTLADTAAFLDISYPPLLRPERKVDVIIHLNYSSGSQTTTLDKASRYFSKQGIPFPKVDLSHIKDENLKECYVFEDPENPKAPIVIFFPLINDTFKKYKAPGVERSPSEMKQGQVDVSSPQSPYGLQCFQYTEEDFDKLVELTSYNIQNNKYLILQSLQRAIERKGQQMK